MSLLTIDRIPIPSHEWLQFDPKNQEFYGVPMHNDIGRKEYQLVVTDKEGKIIQIFSTSIVILKVIMKNLYFRCKCHGWISCCCSSSTNYVPYGRIFNDIGYSV